MKNLSSLITENDQTKKFKFTATVIVDGEVTAANVGDAGELADKQLDKITGFVSGQIDNIASVESEVKENLSDLSNPVDVAIQAYETVVNTYNNVKDGLTDYQLAELDIRMNSTFNK